MRALLLSILLFPALTYSQIHTVTSIANSGPGSLRDVITTAQANDTIRFDPALTSAGSSTITLSSEIVITKSLCIQGSINGGDTLFISGGSSTQLFHLDYSGWTQNFYFEDLAFIDGSDMLVAGILCDGPQFLHINNCTFRNNTTTFGAGAAIRQESGDLIINDSRFTHNSTGPVSSSNCGTVGGAIYIDNGDLEASGSYFADNRSCGEGGAIDNPFGDMLLTNCIFVRNKVISPTALLGGGAIRVGGTSLIQSCVFEHNTSNANAGAIQVYTGYNDDVRIIDCLFRDNKAGLAKGGAIDAQVAQLLEIEGCTFVDNGLLTPNSFFFGGAISSSLASTEISRSTFIDNRAPAISTASAELKNITVVNHTSSTEALIKASLGANSNYSLKSSVVATTSSSPTLNITGATSFTTQGFNVFSNTPTGASSTDQTNKSLASLDIGSYTAQAGKTAGIFPLGPTSVMINNGDPNDNSIAQNGTIYGRRDAGSTEYSLIFTDSINSCGSYQWLGQNYDTTGVYTDTLYNSQGTIDSVGILNLTVTNINSNVLALSYGLSAQEQSPGTTYQWFRCHPDTGLTEILGATDSVLPLPFGQGIEGYWTVEITLNGCVDTSDCVYYSTIGHTENSLRNLTVYPNPSSTYFRVNSAEKFESISIVSLSGQVVLREKYHSDIISVEELAPGTYMVLIEFMGDQSVVRKLIIH